MNLRGCSEVLVAALLIAPSSVDAQEVVDATTIERIQAEAMQRSHVMEIASWLTDVYGPRLTGSPRTRAACAWAVATMKAWGITNAHLEQWNPYQGGQAADQWGPLNQAWTSERFVFRAITPYPFMIAAVPSTGSPGTKQRVAGPAIRFDVHSLPDMKRFAGRLRDAFLLMDSPRPTPAHFDPQATRLTDQQLEALAAGRPSVHKPPPIVEPHYDAASSEAARRWLRTEGVAALVFTSPADGGAIAMSGSGSGGSPMKDEPDTLPSVKVSAESYGRIARILEKGLPVTLELEMSNTSYDQPDAFNVVAEIPGRDPQLEDEVVMMGAHLDSWTYGTGATDDGAGVAVIMEAMRLLSALNLHPRRTIRAALWTGEEQGALGSKAYVQKHLRDWVRQAQGDLSSTQPEYDRFCVYFNLDGGTGKIRGICQQGNAAVGPIFKAWMKPFEDIGMKTAAISDIGGGDNYAFIRVGLPSFGFIQDPIEYETRTCHTSADVYERLQPDDLRFNAAVVASFAWQAAHRDAKLPRIPPHF